LRGFRFSTASCVTTLIALPLSVTPKIILAGLWNSYRPSLEVALARTPRQGTGSLQARTGLHGLTRH